MGVPRAALVLVSALVLLAGCNGLGEDPRPTRDPFVVPRTEADTTSQPTRSTVPQVLLERPPKSGTAVREPIAPVDPVQGGTVVPGETVFDRSGRGPTVAPGVAESGVRNLRAVVRGYEAFVADRSLRVRIRTRLRHPNGTLVASARTDVWLSENHTEFYRVERVTDGRPMGLRNAVWSDGRNVLGVVNESTRRYYDVNPSSAGQPNADLFLGEYVSGSHLRRYLRAMGRASVRPTPNATAPATYRIRARSFDAPQRLPPGPLGSPAVEATSVSLILDERGFLRSVRANYTVLVDGQRLRLSRVARYGTPDVPVPRPTWIDEARRRVEGSTYNGTAVPDWQPSERGR